MENFREHWVVWIGWYSPYTEPPDGRRIIWAACPLGSIRDVDHPEIPPKYSFYCDFVQGMPDFWPVDRVLKNRLRCLERRIKAKISFPALAESMINETIAENPERYSLEGCKEDQERRKQFVQKHLDDQYYGWEILEAS